VASMSEPALPDVEGRPSPFALLDGSPEAMTVLEPVRDRKGRVVEFRLAYANPAAVDVAGRRLADLVGGPPLDFYPEALSRRLHDTYLRILETGESVVFPPAEYGVTVDGTRSTGWYRIQAWRFEGKVVIGYRDITAERTQQLERADERAEARLLQEALLPPVLPLGYGLEMAAAYLPASDAPMGGDWYDAFPVDGGVVLGVGDVAGHGLRAAAVMSEVRNAIRAFASDDPSPERVLTRLNRMLCQLQADEIATALVAIWNPETRTITRANAGHPPVLRLRPGETGFLLPDERGPLLGVDPGIVFRNQDKELRPGTTLVFYTDGLVEERATPLDETYRRLAGFAAGLVGLAPRQVCNRLVEWRTAQGPREDDLCVFAVQLS
jgi:hypothetical protein